jgi:hypothetical protein
MGYGAQTGKVLKMKIVNHTKIPDTTLRLMIKQVTKGINRKIKKITFSYTKKWSFKGYCDSDTNQIAVAFAKEERGKYPFSVNDNRHIRFNFPVYEVNNETEICLSILAHETYHFRAFGSSRLKNTEKRAESYAYKQLQKWRGISLTSLG